MKSWDTVIQSEKKNDWRNYKDVHMTMEYVIFKVDDDDDDDEA